jgi:outer membrane protein assembly factor BamB
VRPPQQPWLAGLLGALLAASAGCASLEASDDRVNPQKPLWYQRPNGAMHVLFLRELTAQSRSSGEPYERGRTEIDPLNGRVFVGTSDHGMYALRASDGSSIWRFETLGAVQSEPLYDSDLDVVYFGSHDGAMYAVHASDGQLVWRYASGAEISRRPVLSGERLVFANGADNLFAVDRRSGKTLWHVHRTPALGREIGGYGGPALDAGVVFFPFSDGHVGAYDVRDGSERWTPIDLSAEAEQSRGEAVRYLDVDTTPVPHSIPTIGRVVFVASYAGGVYALDAERGATVWKNEKATGVTDLLAWSEPAHPANQALPGYVIGEPPVPKHDMLFASSASTGLWALDPTNGHKLWNLPLPEGGITAPVPIAGALIVGTSRYGAFLLSPVQGRPIDGFDLGSGFSQAPGAFGNRAFLLSNAGTLVSVHVDPPPRKVGD